MTSSTTSAPRLLALDVNLDLSSCRLHLSACFSATSLDLLLCLPPPPAAVSRSPRAPPRVPLPESLLGRFSASRAVRSRLLPGSVPARWHHRHRSACQGGGDLTLRPQAHGRLVTATHSLQTRLVRQTERLPDSRVSTRTTNVALPKTGLRRRHVGEERLPALAATRESWSSFRSVGAFLTSSRPGEAMSERGGRTFRRLQTGCGASESGRQAGTGRCAGFASLSSRLPATSE